MRRATLLLATALPTLLAAAPCLAQRAPAARAAPAQSWLSEVKLVELSERDYQGGDAPDWDDL